MQDLLQRLGLKYEDLTKAERETLTAWMKDLSNRQIGVEDVKTHIKSLIDATERELADVHESTSFFSWLFRRKKDLFLKARLRNYLMLQDFLTGPERAKKWIEQRLSNIGPNN